jgi:hypothetical protein
MVTYFNKKDLVKFGNYLLSEKRTESVLALHGKHDDRSKEERLNQVYHADVENFLESIKKVD